jgi:hypothetical protein
MPVRATKKYREPIVRVISLNLQKDGGKDMEGGAFPQRWLDAHEGILAPLRPDIILRQEATYSHLADERRLRAAGDILGMKGILTPNGTGRNPTAMFLRLETFPSTETLYDSVAQRGWWRTPPTVVKTQLAEVPDVDWVLVSWHTAFNSPRGREREAEELTAFADKLKGGTAFLGGGDCNEYPLPQGEKVPPIDWTSREITDPRHVRHRTNAGPNGSRVSCTYLDDTLLGCNLHDAARYVAGENPDALDPTAGHAAEAAGQGGPRRIDRIYLDPWIIQAVLDVNVLDTTGVSDHHGVDVILSRRKLVEALRRSFPPLDLWTPAGYGSRRSHHRGTRSEGTVPA